jgi:hypothetical protein
MPTRGELLLSYDESEIYKEEVEFVKETWNETPTLVDEYGKEPTDEEIDKIVFQRLSDGWASNDRWFDFKMELTGLMRERNPTMEWESPDFHSIEDGYSAEDAKFRIEKGEDLLDKFVDFDRQGNLTYIKIYAYGQNGLCVDPEWQTEKCLLQACRNGFYRDWDKGGICIAAKESDYD